MFSSKTFFVRRYLCTTKVKTKTKRAPHVYSSINKSSSLQEISEYLLQNIVYNENGLVVINKPYGMGLSPPGSQLSSAVVQAFNSAHVGNSYYLTETLPRLAKTLGYDKLEVLKVPQRYASGIGLLGASQKVAESVSACQKRAKPLKRFTHKYWAVGLGVPLPTSDQRKCGITLKSTPGGGKLPVIVKEWSQAAMNRGEVIVSRVRHNTLATAPQQLASLVEIDTSLTKWNFLRVYLSNLLSPTLGDNLFGSRVGSIAGESVLLHPASDAARSPKKLSDDLLTALELQRGEETIVPTHLHLRQVTLINYQGRGKDLVLEAPVPETFQWTCDKLGLQLPEQII